MKRKFFLETGTKFGKLRIMNEIESIKYGKRKYRRFLCECICGNERIVLLDNLISGKTKSCGCLSVIKNKQRATHGLSHHPLYSVWCGMKRRCNNPNEEKYPRYGGRGIKVCKEWKEDFKKFYDWAIENGYKKGLQIDRIDNDGNYEPSNCKWETVQKNTQHTSRIKLTPEDVMDIRNCKLLFRDDISNKEIGNAYGINPNTVAQIINYQTWQNI